MNNFLISLARMKAYLAQNPMLIFFFAVQALLQYQAASFFLHFNNVPSAIMMSLALAAAHVIPAYLVALVGFGSGLANAPGLISKLQFMALGGILAFITSLTFTYCVLGILCLTALSLVTNVNIVVVGTCGLVAAGIGSILDTFCTLILSALGGLSND